ncbi:ABC transporter ATP-binding protein [Brevibacterium casei]|uniref:ABC-type quaternary amine transporter n=1 Tax=Brevibacterium casei TaxID=33889 RepID=A0A269ZCI2_9MICO|nr:ABC transporter ATP-binding protein [Brevibacterium casei]MCT1551971.1 ABC transporter ATP-binding protein [Brevibacterium casei]MCT1561790.1 ABC transporter ATP-binding protein [Brevibacterium casei]MCT2209732.1 ABC transporter ATP-binding protein [Brevibacterium casei]PAK95508.1 spermidine/putrescine ABC transporter ATP-binding protein [Brevibacterium casei]QPS35048.1 ABC transporter ATP-binding protein [Brevibacterium casei]
MNPSTASPQSPTEVVATPLPTPSAAGSEPKSVHFRGVDKSYGPTRVLTDFNIEVEAGSMVSFLGPSGCGKTTTLRILAGFETVDAGDVLVGGESVLGLPPNRRDMGMVFQSYSLFPNLTVGENIEYGLRIRKVGVGARASRRNELLEICGLGGMDARFPHQLSGGQQQRVALARALATRPQVLLLDEPLSALDATVRSALRDEIRRVQQSLGTTTIFITHDQGEALAIADRVAVMSAGRIEQYAAPEVIYSHPATPFAARFVGSINEFAVPREWRVGDHLPDDADGADIVFVRPENLTIAASPTGVLEVTAKTYTGERTMVRLARAGTGRAEWSASLSSADAAGLSLGERVSPRILAEVALRLPRTEAGGPWK